MFLSCKNENLYLTKKVNTEKFDFEIYKNSEYGNRVFTKKDGTKITMIDFDKENGGVQSETPPKVAGMLLNKCLN